MTRLPAEGAYDSSILPSCHHVATVYAGELMQERGNWLFDPHLPHLGD